MNLSLHSRGNGVESNVPQSGAESAFSLSQ